MNIKSIISNRSIGRLTLLHIPMLLFAAFMFAGCATRQFDEFDKLDASTKPEKVEPEHTEVILLQEGDIVKISFPGSPSLDTTQQIRRDGKISLSLVGEVEAAGKTPDQLKADLINLYASQISSKEVNVAVESSSFPVFVTGFVIHPGKIKSDHPITALEAIMESGGFDYGKADLKSVRVIRLEDGVSKTYTLNLKSVMDGQESQQFYLKPSDIVYVPERFSWF